MIRIKIYMLTQDHSENVCTMVDKPNYQTDIKSIYTVPNKLVRIISRCVCLFYS